MARKRIENDELGPLTPGDMVQWLQQEIRDLSRATELRIQEAAGFVTDFAMGKISEEQMMKRKLIYTSKWGDEVIPGVLTDENMTNEEITKRLVGALPRTVQEDIRRWQSNQPLRRQR
jgi:hypothetical protein